MGEPLAVIKTRAQKQNETAIESARELLAACESGECEEFVAMCVGPSKHYWRIASGGISATQTGGLLLTASLEVLGFKAPV